jgi:hypothetical protein
MKMTTTRLAQMIFLLDKTTTRLSQSLSMCVNMLLYRILYIKHILENIFSSSLRNRQDSYPHQGLIAFLSGIFLAR